MPNKCPDCGGILYYDQTLEGDCCTDCCYFQPEPEDLYPYDSDVHPPGLVDASDFVDF